MRSSHHASGILTIDLDALAANYQRLRRAAEPAECAAVVKADAYGLGLEPVARRLEREGCRRFFVASLAEGAALREVLPGATVYVLEGVAAGSEQALAAQALVPVLNSMEQVGLWSAFARSRPDGARAVVHIDTGMSRLGLSAADVERLGAHPDLLAGVTLDHVMTHLACADQPEHPQNARQIASFEALRARLPPAPIGIASSAGALAEAAHGDLVRLGIGLYGGNPFSDRPNPMREVVRLRGRILQLREIEPGVPVGYGATYTRSSPGRLATIGVGYADGYLRSLGNRGFVSVAGARAPVVGRVSMDLVTVDVSQLAPDRVRTGMLVDLIGGGAPIDEVAELAGTISYELLTRLGSRLQRIYRESDPRTAT